MIPVLCLCLVVYFQLIFVEINTNSSIHNKLPQKYATLYTYIIEYFFEFRKSENSMSRVTFNFAEQFYPQHDYMILICIFL